MRKPRKKGAHGRVYMRTYGEAQVNTGPTPPRVDDIFAYRRRAQALDDHFAKLFGMEKHIDGEPRIKAQKLARRWATDDYVGMAGVHEHICVKNGNRIKVFLFCTKDRKLYYFIRFNYFDMTVSKSMGCHDRSFALTCFNRGMIEWEETVHLHSP